MALTLAIWMTGVALLVTLIEYLLNRERSNLSDESATPKVLLDKARNKVDFSSVSPRSLSENAATDHIGSARTRISRNAKHTPDKAA